MSADSKLARSSPISRLFPMPASPVTNRIPPRPARMSPITARPAASSASRPDDRSTSPRVPSGATRTRQRPPDLEGRDAVRLPLERQLLAVAPSEQLDSRAAAWQTRRGPCPGAAADCNRAAVFTVSPNARVFDPFAGADRPEHDRPGRDPHANIEPLDAPASCDLGAVVPRSPGRSEGRRAEGALGVVLVRERARRTARGPRRRPDPSPCPRRPPTARTILATASPMMSLTSSGSSRSASAVDPTRSANTAVTTLRSSRMVTGRSGRDRGHRPYCGRAPPRTRGRVGSSHASCGTRGGTAPRTPWARTSSAGDLLEAMSDELLSRAGSRSALSRLLRRGMRGRFTGLDALRARLRDARRRGAGAAQPGRAARRRSRSGWTRSWRPSAGPSRSGPRTTPACASSSWTRCRRIRPARSASCKDYRFVDPRGAAEVRRADASGCSEQVLGSYFRQHGRRACRPCRPRSCSGSRTCWPS